MNQELSAGSITPEIWNELEFEWKNQLSVNDKNELVLLPNAFRKEKVLTGISADNLSEQCRKLSDNFSQIQQVAADLLNKWESTDNKLELKGVLRETEQQISQMDAVGDFSEIEKVIGSYKTEIDRILDENVAERTKLIEEAKVLAQSEEWHQATEQYKSIIEKWKTAPEVRKKVSDDLWKELNDAKDVFFERKRKYYEELEKEQMVNWDRKIELCEKAVALADSLEWKEATDKMNAYMEEWKTIGPVPSAEKNEELWERFNTARKHFFDRKHEHSATIKAEQDENYIKKTTLLEEAERLSTSNDWKNTAERLDEMQKQWEDIGRVPKEHSDELWSRWRAARDQFYDAKRAQAKEYKQSLQENYERKKILTERAEHLSLSEDWRNATDELAELMTEWKTIGPVPREYGDELWNRFNEARRGFFRRKDEDREKRKQRFEQKSKARLGQTESFLDTLNRELEEDEEQLAEFRESETNVTGENKKDLELKEHLAHLIDKLEKTIAKRKAKIEDVSRQLEKLKGGEEETKE